MVTFLWVGNSIANFSRADAGALLEGFFTACHGLGMVCQFIVGVHACQDETQLAVSYNSSDPVLCNFILHGLENVNFHLGQEVFRPGDWVCSCEFDRADRTLRVYYEAIKEVSIAFGNESRDFQKGDRILAIISGKWNLKDIQDMCATVGLNVSHSWWSRCMECGESNSLEVTDRSITNFHFQIQLSTLSN